MTANTLADFMSRLAGSWADWALAASWQLALLVALVALAAFASRRLSARFRYLLWMLVLIKAITPPSLGTAWSIGNWAGPEHWIKVCEKVVGADRAPDSAAPASAPPAKSAAQSATQRIGPDEGLFTVPDSANPAPMAAKQIPAPSTIAANPDSWSASAMALAVWLSGLALLALFIALRYWRLARALARASEVDEGPLRVTLERLAIRLGRRDPPALILSDAVSSPFLFGLLRPRIVLPASLPETLTPEQLEDVLLHELAHWRRRDLPASWLQILVQAIFWFHPLVWLAGTRLRHERECACDEEALERGCSQARRYGESLLRVLLAARGRSAVTLGFLGIFERNTRLQKRLEEIMNQETKIKRCGAWSWLFIILFAALCLPMAAQNNVGSSTQSMRGAPEPQADVLHDKAAGLFEQGKFREAIPVYRQIYDKYPKWNYASAALMMIGICQNRMGDNEKAIESLKLAIEKYPAVRGFSEASYLHLIAIYLENGKNTEAEDVAARFKTLVAQGTLDQKQVNGSFYRNTIDKVGAMEPGGQATVRPTAAAAKTNSVENPAWMAKLTENQRLFAEWTNRQFDRFLDRRDFSKWPEPERAALLEKSLRILGGPQDREYYQAINTLGALGDKKAVRPLLAIATDRVGPDCRDNWMAARALGMIGDTSAVPDLIHLTYHTNTNTHFWAQISLVRLTGENFGYDWMKWGEWWNARGGRPPFKPAKIRWWDDPKFDEASTAQALKKSDQEFIDKIKARQGSGGSASASASSEDPAKWLNDTWIVTFKGKPPYQPRTPMALLGPFNERHPSGIRSHHFRTEVKGDELIGTICIDTTAGKDAVEKMLGQSDKLAPVAAVPATAELFKHHIAKGQPSLESAKYAPETTAAPPPAVPGEPPKILGASPAVGATDVDPATTEITVTFDRDMRGGMSWTGGGPQFPPVPQGARASWRDKRTCVLPVKLEEGHFYRVGINSTSFRNFRSAEGMPAQPSAIYFTTRGASEELKAKARKPEVVMMEPANGAAGVDPEIKELRVTFNVPMGGGFSWTGGGPNYPEAPEGQRPRWSEDRRTCIRPVKLKPGWEYQLGLNSPSHKNFQSEGGVPLEPMRYTFKTRQ